MSSTRSETLCPHASARPPLNGSGPRPRLQVFGSHVHSEVWVREQSVDVRIEGGEGPDTKLLQEAPGLRISLKACLEHTQGNAEMGENRFECMATAVRPTTAGCRENFAASARSRNGVKAGSKAGAARSEEQYVNARKNQTICRDRVLRAGHGDCRRSSGDNKGRLASRQPRGIWMDREQSCEWPFAYEMTVLTHRSESQRRQETQP